MFGVASTMEEKQGRKLFRKDKLPRLKDTDILELYHLRSFSKPLVDTPVGRFLIQTVGLALRNINNNDIMVLEFQPANYSASFLPIIKRDYVLNSTYLFWDKRGEVYFTDILDTAYWQQSTFLARINGVVYENYIKWVEDYLSDGRLFTPQAICSSTVDDLSCFTKSQTWDSFLRDSLWEFADLAVQMHAIIPPRASEFRYISWTEPIEVAAVAGSPTHHLPVALPTAAPTAPPKSLQPTSSKLKFASLSPLSSVSAAPTRSPPSLSPSLSPERTPAPVSVLEATSATSAQPSPTPPPLAGALESSTAREEESDNADTFTSGSNRNNNNNINKSKERQKDGAGGVGGLRLYSEHEVAGYYVELMSCMQGDVPDSHCLSTLNSGHGLVHIDAQRYYLVKPKHPFLYVHDFLQVIPDAQIVNVPSSDASDLVISIVLLVGAVLGLCAGLWKLKILHWCWAKSSTARRRRVSGAAPVAGGYSSQSSELPVYKVWEVPSLLSPPPGGKVSGRSGAASGTGVSPSQSLLYGWGSSPVPFDNHSNFDDNIEIESDNRGHNDGKGAQDLIYLSTPVKSRACSTDNLLQLDNESKFSPMSQYFKTKVFGQGGGGGGGLNAPSDAPDAVITYPHHHRNSHHNNDAGSNPSSPHHNHNHNSSNRTGSDCDCSDVGGSPGSSRMTKLSSNTNKHKNNDNQHDTYNSIVNLRYHCNNNQPYTKSTANSARYYADDLKAED